MAKYLGRRGGPPSQSWRTFLTNHVSQLASIDFFTVPTATFRVLFVFVVLSQDRRRIVHVNVTAHPTAAWTAQQLREAWPWDTAPRFIIRDRDAIYGSDPQRTVQRMGIEEVLIAPRCPWQNPFVARVIGSLRRECLNHIIVWNERSLRRHLQRYLAYYHEWRTHLSLDQDAPVPRAAQPPARGTIVSFPHAGGLHHHYERRAASPSLSASLTWPYSLVVRPLCVQQGHSRSQRWRTSRTVFSSCVLATLKHAIGSSLHCRWNFW